MSHRTESIKECGALVGAGVGGGVCEYVGEGGEVESLEPWEEGLGELWVGLGRDVGEGVVPVVEEGGEHGELEGG